MASLAVDDDLRASAHTPAGLDIGARSAPEVALSILAEIVSSQHERGKARTEPAGSLTPERAPAQAPALTRDPVCGLTVVAAESWLHVDTSDTTTGRVYFCGTGCRTAYLDNPTAYP